MSRAVPFLLALALYELLAGPAAAQTPPVKKVPYRVIEQWSIPNNGHGRVIVIDPSHRRAADLRALARQLRDETVTERVAVVVIYDDERAARLWRTLGTPDEPRDKRTLAFHDRHQIGSYLRNTYTGENTFQFSLEGFGGPAEIVK